jgi:hypothetical protein
MRLVIPVSRYLKDRYIDAGYCYQCKRKLEPIFTGEREVLVCHNCRIAPYKKP